MNHINMNTMAIIPRNTNNHGISNLLSLSITYYLKQMISHELFVTNQIKLTNSKN